MMTNLILGELFLSFLKKHFLYLNMNWEFMTSLSTMLLPAKPLNQKSLQIIV